MPAGPNQLSSWAFERVYKHAVECLPWVRQAVSNVVFNQNNWHRIEGRNVSAAYSKGWMTFSPAGILSVEQDRGCANPFCKTARQKSSPEISVHGGQTVQRNFNVLQIEFKISPTTQFWVFFQWSRQIMTGKQKAARLSSPKLSSGSNKQTTNKMKPNWTGQQI